VFNRILPERRHLVLAEFAAVRRDGVELAANFDLIPDVRPRD
jgi:hypothetical protein